MVIRHRLTTSVRGQIAPPSPVRKLTPLANIAKARGTDVLHVNIGQPDIPTPEPIFSAIRSYRDPIIPYAPSAGYRETIEAWCAYYATHGYTLDPSQVLVTTGGSESLWFAFMAIGDPGDEIILFEPTYANYFGFGASTGVKPVPIKTESDEGFHLPSRDLIEAVITPRTRAICIANPNNPTGTVYSEAELRALVEIAVEHDLFLISDETYRELVFDGLNHFGLLGLTDAEVAERIIIVDSVSKRFSATGTRVGCLVSRNEAVMDAVGRFAQARLSSPTIEQLSVVPMLTHPTGYTDWLRGEYEQRRNVVYDGLVGAELTCRKPNGAFYIMVDLPIDDCDRFATWLLTDFSSNNQTVMVAPGAGFYFTPGEGRQQARIAYVLNQERLTRAIEILAEALKQYPGATA